VTEFPVNQGGKTLLSQAEYYNERWTKFTYANLYGHERCLFILKALFETQIAEPRICDLGCGSGWLTGILCAFGPATGVELSPEAVDQARARYSGATFIAADATRWEPEPSSFDVVVSQEVIEHIEDQGAYLAVVRRALRPGGYLLMTTPNLRVLDAVPPPDRKEVWQIQPIELPLYRSQLTSLLEASGFQVLETGSVVDAMGRTGLHRLVNSARLQLLFRYLGIHHWWRQSLLNRDFGMYLTTVARLPHKP
jgi:2-polyprenyl-3-methyl-5-hydroxy-6-metoxy-1,4-benzoquinol methylase